MHKLPFGLRSDGRLVDVTQVARGLACDCRCAGCGEVLLAKKGEVNVQHFAHHSGAECATGAETALHLAAKQLVADKRWIRLPTLEVRASRSDPECGLFDVRKVFGHNEAWHFHRVALELTVDEIRPDAVGYIDETTHGVEIRVTHKVEVDKQAYLASLKLASIEVNLAPLVGKAITFEALEAAVIESADNKKWLFHPRQTEWEALLLEGFDEWRLNRLAVLAQQRVRLSRPPAPTPKPNPQPSREDVYRLANEKYRASSDSEKWARLERTLGVPRDRFPGHLRVALREGGDAVLADKALWQGALFAQFVFGALSGTRQGKPMPNVASLGTWLAQRFGARNDDTDAAGRAAHAYIGYLRSCGFLKRDGFDYIVVHDGLLAPAKQVSTPTAPRQNALLQSGRRVTTEPDWQNTWPDRDRLTQWATEVAWTGDGYRVDSFDAEYFLDWLWHLWAPASLEDVSEALQAAGGNPAQAYTVLQALGLVVKTRRIFSYGDPAPWLPC